MLRVSPPVLIALTLSACAKSPDEPASVRSDRADHPAQTADPSPPSDNQPSSLATAQASASPVIVDEKENETADRSTPLGAVALPDMASCAQRCVQQNQMRAVAPEQIESDCQRSCHAECLEFCKADPGDRPASFEETCRSDCEKERERVQQRRN